MAKARRRRRNRPFVLLIALSLGLLAVAWRLTMIQTVEANRYQELAEDQTVRHIKLPPRRGTLYDREGEELAVSVVAASVYATPYDIEDVAGTARQLAPVIDVPEEELLNQLSDPKDCCFLFLARQIDNVKGEKVEELDLPGIGVLEESRRRYPYGALAAHVLGFAGTDNEGLAGLELHYDKRLSGREGKLVAEMDPMGRPIPGGTFRRVAPRNGESIVLTIDKDIQYKAEEELSRVVRDTQAVGGTIIVLDPRSGEIYAMANEPTFNLNYFSKAKPNVFRNRAVVDVYEPGSVMKALVAAAALEEQLFKPESSLYLRSTITVGNKTIGESHPRPARDFTFSEIISESSNVGIVTVGMKLGKNRLYRYFKDFGFLESTGVDFPGEAEAVVPEPDRWSKTTIGTVPFGQGIAVTPLHMTQVFSIIANDGRSVEPRFLTDVSDSNSLSHQDADDEPVQGRKVLSLKTVRAMREMLAKVVEEGTGTRAAMADYRVAGKTGTAQKPRTNGRGYAAGKYVGSFIGFAPVEDPHLVVAVMIDEPKGTYYGGLVAAPVFQSVTEFSLRHLKIPPPKKIPAGNERE